MASKAPGRLVKVAVNKTITDPVMGDVVIVKSVVRNFPIPKTSGIYGMREIVLVEMTIKSGSKYYSIVGDGSFRIVTADGGYYNTEDAAFRRLIAKAGYKPLPDTVHSGKTATGWYAFVVSPIGSKKLSLRLVRLPATVMGSDKTIPRKNFDVVLIG